MTEHPLDSAKLKLARAQTHIDDLQREINAYLGRKPYRWFTERDSSTGEKSVIVELTERVPTELRMICGDAISNIRSALDHVVSELAIKNDRTAVHVSFPTANSAGEFLDKRVQGKIEKLSAPAIELIGSLEPYQHGKGHIFWVVNKLETHNKHRKYPDVGVLHAGSLVTVLLPEHGIQRFGAAGPSLDVAKGRIVLIRGGAEGILDISTTFYVIFRGVDGATNWLVTRALQDALDAARDFVWRCEGAFFAS